MMNTCAQRTGTKPTKLSKMSDGPGRVTKGESAGRPSPSSVGTETGRREKCRKEEGKKEEKKKARL